MRIILAIVLALALIAGCKKKSDENQRPQAEPPVAGTGTDAAPTPPPAPPDAAPAWKPRAGKGFTVDAPQDPDQNQKDLPTAAGPLPTTYYGGYVPDGSPGAMQVMVSDIPPAILKKTTPAKLLTIMRDGLAKKFGGTVEKEENVKLGGETGKDLRYKGKDPEAGEFASRMRLFIHKGKLFQVQVIHAADAADFAAQGDKFVESFAFVD